LNPQRFLTPLARLSRPLIPMDATFQKPVERIKLSESHIKRSIARFLIIDPATSTGILSFKLRKATGTIRKPT